jgi:hypothetical protein
MSLRFEPQVVLGDRIVVAVHSQSINSRIRNPLEHSTMFQGVEMPIGLFGFVFGADLFQLDMLPPEGNEKLVSGV